MSDMGKEFKTVSAESLEEWRRWLEQHFDSEKEIWLVYPRRHTGLPTVSDEDSAEEALCFGWIDSLIKKVDDDHYSKKFTPRSNTAKWSEVNIRRVKKLIVEGRMKDAGRAKIPDEVLAEDYVSYTANREAFSVPEEVNAFLGGYPKAQQNFDAMPKSSKRMYCGWIMSAKREETRLKRLQEAVGLLEANVKNPMK
jgi:uncharacterized protein YdeI (YjbR/CyaY-like superfamily)